MLASGYDYLDSNIFQSGYPGDLFGFSIDLSNNDLVVGTPYNGYTGETVEEWSSLTFFGQNENGVVSGIELCGKGGRERTWGRGCHYSMMTTSPEIKLFQVSTPSEKIQFKIVFTNYTK